jgi:tRNA/tmRNA/rRNA uracil-C5-methylase (TrmA/RlmC/RlmD family)
VAGASTGDAPEQRFPLPGGLELRVGPETFTQVNWAVNLRMVGDLVARANPARRAGFSDLFAGAGNFALPLLATGMRGLVVERSAEAVARARASARAAGLSGGEFRVGCAEIIAPGSRPSTRQRSSCSSIHRAPARAPRCPVCWRRGRGSSF